jgi:mono/diheme cytochrome c family protein
MKPTRIAWVLLAAAGVSGLISCSISRDGWLPSQTRSAGTGTAQVPRWSEQDMDVFLHGSMSTEVVPETVLRAFIRTYPDLFPTADLSHLGLIPDPAFGWPVGFSRRHVPHLGGLSAVGVNCASCHVGEIIPATGGAPVRVLGMTSHFDAEAFFGSVIVAGFRTADPANMKRLLAAYLMAGDPIEGERMQPFYADEWQRQESNNIAAIGDDPSGSKGLAPGALHPLAGEELRFGHSSLAHANLAALSHSMLKLFHNMRTALHVPDQPPEKLLPPSGPGRNDAFGLLSAALFGAPRPYSPVKYGLVWNVENRHWVHWDGNTQSPIGRNLLASLGLGSPLIGKHGQLNFARIKRQTDLSEHIRAPRYPFAIDAAAAKRGAAGYQAHCAACHEGSEELNARFYDPVKTGTDPLRAESFTPLQAERFDKFLAELETPGYQPPAESGIRSTQKYLSPGMAGVWARSPYSHNGSVRTMQELLTLPDRRARSFHRGSRVYDPAPMGYTDDGAYLFDTVIAGNSNRGHDYGTDLSADQKHDLIEYLKTL